MRVAKMLTEKIIFIFIFFGQALSNNDTGGQNGPCFCFPQTVICYLLFAPQKIRFQKLLYCYIVTLGVDVIDPSL